MVFSGFQGESQLSLGYVLGVRGFRLDEMGRFTGWTHQVVWTPGMNTAECQKTEVVCGKRTHDPYTGTRRHRHVGTCYRKIKCEKDIADCDHGFWAYFTEFDNQNTDLKDESFPAIIKGYGKVVLGTKGFRSEKAEIVAVVVPNTYDSDATQVALIRRNYPDVQLFDTAAAMFDAYPVEDQTPLQPKNPKDPAFWSFDPKDKTKVLRRVEKSRVV